MKYSFFNTKSNAREDNSGWRLDYFLLDRASFPAVIDSEILDEYYGSDHCPIRLTLDLGKLSPGAGLAVPTPDDKSKKAKTDDAAASLSAVVRSSSPASEKKVTAAADKGELQTKTKSATAELEPSKN